MPKFVPVADPEAPRWEQDEAKLAKHRNFDSHVVARDQTEQRKLAAGRRAATNADEGRANRGFEQGAVGWGVVGTFGSEARDADAQARPAEGNLKMVQNDKGLWVRAAREEGAVEGDKPRPPCMTGRQCMQLHLPGGLHGGCFAEIEARESRRYRAELYVYHDMEGGKNVEDLPGRCGCRLISFDGRDQYRTSKRARSNKEWERLAVEFIGTPGDKAIIAVQGDKSFGGVVLIDACRIFLLGRDEIGDTCAELEAAVEEPRINKNGVLRVSVVELVNIPRLAGEPPPARPGA